MPHFEIDEIPRPAAKSRHGPGRTTDLPRLRGLALPPGGKGPRTFQCLDCDRPDPLKTDQATGWLKGELQPPK